MFLQTIVYSLTYFISLGMVIAFQEGHQIDQLVWRKWNSYLTNSFDTLVKMPLVYM